jgi:glutathionylspermidine amidase/synthetase
MTLESSKVNQVPFGQVLGISEGGVASYSSDYDSVDHEQMADRSAYRHYVDGVYTGYKWQCVEFVRRWMLVNKGYVFEDIAMAYDIFRLKHVRDVKTNQLLPLHSFDNGSLRLPEPGSLLIWEEGGEFETTGHVAVITEVSDTFVRIAEQNFDHIPWPDQRNYSRELTACHGEDGSFWIRCTIDEATILGWVTQTNNKQHAEVLEDSDPALFELKLRELRASKTPKKAWINLANEDEHAYVAMNGQKLHSQEAYENTYCVMSQTAKQEVVRATNELHALFLHATDYVLQNEYLLEHFNIPNVLWPRIKQSWNNRRNQMITGRFDFSLSARGLKLYEYNADSASCHMECGKIQGLWGDYKNCDDGADAGSPLFFDLVDAWKENHVDGLVHIMLDDDDEENYHALYMQSTMKKAGIESKLVYGTQQLSWSKDGYVVDVDGLAIKWVWKTWAWETALEQLRDELNNNEYATEDIPKNKKPQLMDVFLHPETMVIEPLWTVVTSNKAMLPILWQMFPNHPYLLNAQFELTPDLQKEGYVSKPIAGRCGLNIILFDKQDKTLSETQGQFSQQDSIFQSLYPLPKFNGLNVQLCTFTAGGYYAGACIRTDASMIITNKSDLLPLRVAYSDKEWRQAAVSS